MKFTNLFVGVLAMAGLAAAQDAISINISGVGTCTVQTWSFGAVLPTGTPGTGSGAGRTQLGALMLTKGIDSCTTGLLRSVTSGAAFTSGTVTLTQTDSTGRTPLLTIQLTDALVVSDQIGGTTASATPVESVSFSFQKIQINYYSSSGTQEFGWNVATNTPF
jgi:type VI secretion system Hcp family effector